MVLYFTSDVVSPPAVIYMGKDKFENEDLIKHGWPEDVWFHVDKLSSAHVYLRLTPPMTWTDIPQPLLDDLAQLCKANSIEGNKKNNITVIYTPWSNLLKRGDMATGQVSFKNPQLVRRVFIAERVNMVVNRLNRTKKIESPDLHKMRVERDRDEGRERREVAKKAQKAKREGAEAKHRAEKSYKDAFAVDRSVEKPKTSNVFDSDDDEDGDSDDEISGRYAGDLDDLI
ncbi:hypothetical protein LPJ53_002079 [Coemansia erecta]|uniref:NFACT RNA-binding domain-containing protein n=1 Tax=Coemansia erecta TaxID=147472 RepID=A0A9W8CS70_9FUNG|nr:hypothetical protein LPJ53_002079 [Coemansia erecta]